MFQTATFEDVLNGLTADIYFYRAKEILEKQKITKHVKAEFCAKSLQYPWGVFAGVEEFMPLLKKLPVKATLLPEGTLFRNGEPVLTIEGRYVDFCLYETALLGLMCQASGVATKAARLRQLAPHHSLLSFGARRMHPAIAPMIERNAYIGGCDGVSVVQSAKMLSIEATGTMPHALILVIGDEEKAYKLFHKMMPKSIKRVVLIDTVSDEKFGSLKAIHALKNHLFGVRLDTPSSRKGNFIDIIEEVRWELDYRGFKNVKIIVSGGLDEADVQKLAPHVDGFGIGTAISNAPVINFSMDIIEIDGKPMAKRGKLSGEKKVVRCEKCLASKTVPMRQKTAQCNQCKKSMTVLTQKMTDLEIHPPKIIREYVLKQLKGISQTI